jgi:integrase
MSIYRRGRRWAVSIDLDRDPSGPRRRPYLGSYKTKKEAQAVEVRALNERDNGIDLSPSKVTLRSILERYNADQVVRKLEPKTIREDGARVRLYVEPCLGDVLVSKLKPTHLSELYTRLLSSGRRNGKGGISPKTLRHVHSIIKAALAWAVRRQLASRNVADGIEIPRVRRSEAKAFSVDETRRLLSAARNTDMEGFVALAFTTGARRGELLALRWEDVDLEAPQLKIRASLSQVGIDVRLKGTKSNQSRRIPLSTLAQGALRKQRACQAAEKLQLGETYKDQGFVFATATGDPWVPSAATDKFRKLARRSQVSSTRLHDARHTAATWLLAEGTDIATVASILGHAQASTTLNIYSHVIASVAESAIQKIDQHLAQGENRKHS